MQPENNAPQVGIPPLPSPTSFQPPAPEMPVSVSNVQPNSFSPPTVNYADFWTRFGAVFIDMLILATISFVMTMTGTLVSGMMGYGTNDQSLGLIIMMMFSVLSYGIQIGYPIYFIGSKGQTPGKMVMKIKVVKIDTGEAPGYATAFLRELIGKFVSGLLLGIGYLVSIKDPKKQTWHDKIAKTVVVKI